MTVLINKWDDGHFCDYCQEYATVKETEGIFICKSCLLAMVAEIDKAILEAAVKSRGKE